MQNSVLNVATHSHHLHASLHHPDTSSHSGPTDSTDVAIALVLGCSQACNQTLPAPIRPVTGKKNLFFLPSMPASSAKLPTCCAIRTVPELNNFTDS